MYSLDRKKFLSKLAIGASGILLLPSLIHNQTPAAPPKPQKDPPLDIALVKEFVGAAHKDPAKVKMLLTETPALLNSVNNLGSWDWEDAIGAAGHVGIPELATFLLEQGARPTICVAAMLGKIEVVKAYISAFPAMKDAVGPHKISLYRHAKAGGENAKEVLEYLVSIGAKQ